MARFLISDLRFARLDLLTLVSLISILLSSFIKRSLGDTDVHGPLMTESCSAIQVYLLLKFHKAKSTFWSLTKAISTLLPNYSKYCTQFGNSHGKIILAKRERRCTLNVAGRTYYEKSYLTHLVHIDASRLFEKTRSFFPWVKPSGMNLCILGQAELFE